MRALFAVFYNITPAEIIEMFSKRFYRAYTIPYEVATFNLVT